MVTASPSESVTDSVASYTFLSEVLHQNRFNLNASTVTDLDVIVSIAMPLCHSDSKTLHKRAFQTPTFKMQAASDHSDY